MRHRSSRAVLAVASANIARNCDLVNSFGCIATRLRADKTLSTGRAQATNNAGFRAAPTRFWALRLVACARASTPGRSNLAQTALWL
jgi:hypothetical protein